MTRGSRWSLLWLSVMPVLAAEAPAQKWIDVSVDQLRAGRWEARDPRTVFRQGDALRFRFRSNVPGYLYVISKGSSGQWAWLYPSVGSAAPNFVDADKDHVIPAGDGSFQVSAGPGYDTLYWILAPNAVGGGAKAPAPESTPDSSPAETSPLLPRCQDQTNLARGGCIDRNSGPRIASARGPLPGLGGEGLQSRDLRFSVKPAGARISAPGPFRQPIFYEFRLAHE